MSFTSTISLSLFAFTTAHQVLNRVKYILFEIVLFVFLFLVLHLLNFILILQVEDYIAPRFSHKRKSKLRQKILEAHSNVKDLNLIEAKMNFIKAWQSLPEFGTSLFVVKFHGERREELVGIAFNR